MKTSNNRLTDKSEPDFKLENNKLNDSVSTLLCTKFMIPSPPLNCIDRVLLTARLDEVLDKKLTVISAPAGYGKSTLLGMWLAKNRTSIKSAWVSLDEKDNDMQTFWKYILMALEKSVSGTVEYYASTDFSILVDSMDLLVNGLINRLSNMAYKIVLVIDDYHMVFEESIHDSLLYFINHLPPNVHIVITSRNIPPIKLARLRGHGELLELKTEDLRLSSQEASEFLTGTMKLSLCEDEVTRLAEWTEGWIAALNLTALSIKSSSRTRNYLNDYSHINDYMVEYMAEEMFNLLEAEQKTFLIETSMLETLNSSLCNAVVGISNSQEIIDALERNNIFANALDNKKNNYRYHSLFTDFLKNKLMETFPDKVEVLYLRASQWYEDNAMIQEALDYSIKVNNYINTIRLIEKYGEIIIINRDLIRLASIIEALPSQLAVDNSKICALYTMAVAGKNDSVNNGVFVGNTLVSFDSNIFLESEEDMLLIRMIIAYANENFKIALEYGNKMLEHISEDNIFQCLLYKILVQIYCVTGDSKKAEAYLDKYISAIKGKNHYNELFMDIIYIHAMVHILCGVGKYKDALDIICKFEKRLDSYNILLPAAANSIYLDSGYLHYEFGEMELSYSSAIKCIEISSIKMDVFRLISGYVLVARVNQNMGNYNKMNEFIKKAVDLSDKHNPRLMMYNIIHYIVRTLLAAKQIEHADSLINKYDMRIDDSFDVFYEEAHFALADLYIVKGEFERAEYILDRLYIEVSGTERNISFIKIMILKALLSNQKRNIAEAIGYMNDALKKALSQGYISTFSDFGIQVAEIICELLNKTEEMDIRTEGYIDYATCIVSHIKGTRNLLGGADQESLKNLSRRETEVINCIFLGLTNKEIAARLFVAESTVKKHINNIYGKIGVVNRSQILYFDKKTSSK